MIAPLIRALSAATAMSFTLLPSAYGQKVFPAQPIKIIVGSDAGSAPDVLARALGKEMEPLLKQPVVIENKAGAAGTIGATLVMQSAADGYTLLMGTVANIALAPSFYAIKYKPAESFTPIGMVASVPLVLVSSTGLGATDFAQLRAKLTAPEADQKHSYSSPGIGGPQHLAGVLMEKQLGIKLLHVPYKSGGAAMVAVAGGETQLAFAGIPAALPLLQAKRVAPMFVTSPRRSPALPDVPSAKELGMPEFEVDNWHTLLAPAGLPPAVRSILEEALRGALQSASVKSSFLKLGAEPWASTGTEAAEKISREEMRWSALVKESGANKGN